MILRDGVFEVPPGKLVECITHLEMTSRPAPRPERPGASFELERVERPDPGWYRELFRRVGTDWLWVSRLLLDDDTLGAIIGNPAVRVFALRSAGREEGLLELDFRVAGECELAFFGLTGRLIGRGAGRWLMNRALDLAWAEPIDRFWVHTCSFDHPAALAFYVRSGFRAFRREVEIADDPRLAGLLPRDAAPHIPIV
ncbi:MAG: GNAT family N-acetyltransferase [Geminicoccaceae bacterium]|nr:GNAT family N-acetyltransferase [Geminicoccaceae bacterium]